jgi:hypothetical protein
MARLTSITINDTGALTLPSGTTAQRISQGATLDSYTSVGTTSWTCPANVFNVEVLVVAGGGGGGRHSGGGGGGGGVIYRPAFPVVPGTVYTVTVGGGGGGGTIAAYPTNGGNIGGNGGNSVFGSLTATGGGGGGWNSAAGASGGSGGGSTGHSGPGEGAGTAGQGFAGGNTPSRAGAYASSGGGGAGGPGQPGIGTNLTDVTYSITTTAGATVTTKYNRGGDGGPGVFYSISGQERAYGGGGGGNIQYNSLPNGVGGSGGSGVGGDGSPGDGVTEGSQYGYDGMANTGGGGGGSHYNAPGSTSTGLGGRNRSAAGGSGVVYIRYTASSLNSATGSIRYTTTGTGNYVTGTSPAGLEFKAGSASTGAVASDYWKPIALPFLQRTIISNNYMMGGYKDGTPWTTVNRTVTATDTTTNLGDLLETPTNYKGGAGSRSIFYMFGATATNAGSSNYITAFNMRTESAYTSAGSRYLSVSAGYNGVMFKEHYKAYTHQSAQGTGIEEFNMITETTNGVVANIWQDYSWAMSWETHGILWASDGASNRNFHFATNTPVTRGGTQVSAHHQQKSVQSKVLYCYAGNEGNYNGGYNYRRTNMVTDITSGTVAKPSTNCGEENYTMGQEHQYMIGTYNGSGQVNVSSKFSYASESGVTGGTSMEPKGHAGASSATCGWRD